ncbi:glutaredoxin family protein [Candidatus Saccharibacteria bacterium]|nr:glutaredoxin family protein [Candidatus Saccharibacteria bacterium]
MSQQTKKVTVYHTNSCVYCHKAMEFMDSKGVPYIAKNVQENSEYAKEMFEKSRQFAVPVIVVDDEVLPPGYNQALLASKLGLAN